MKSLRIWSAFVLAAAVMLSSCKKDDEPVNSGGGGPTSYLGTIGNGVESGALSFSVDNAGAVTGTIGIVGGSTVNLSGTLSGTALGISGGGYTFTGALASQRITGTYTGPNGGGSFEADQASATSVTIYCGVYNENPPGTESGTFNMIINTNGTIRVMAVEAGTGDVTNLEGTLSGSTISLHPPGSPGTIVATGTISGTSISGSYNTGSSAGTWMGAVCQ